jgi:FkbM family methyltransferase
MLGAIRRHTFSWMLQIYARHRYNRKTVHPNQIPLRVRAKRYIFHGQPFDFLLAGNVGERWYGNGNVVGSMGKMGRWVRKKDTVIDFGAHQGLFSLLYRLLVGAEGAVYSVEPFDHLADVTRFNASLNKFSNIHVFNCGLGDTAGITPLTSISPLSNRADAFAHFVANFKLDDFAALKPDYVKMDIEGFELEAFRHADKFLQTQPIIQLSLHPKFITARGGATQEILKTLRRHRYTLGHMDPAGEFRPAKEIDVERPSFEIWALPANRLNPEEATA